LEIKISPQKEEEEKREKVLIDHIKEKIDKLNHLEEEFCQE